MRLSEVVVSQKKYVLFAIIIGALVGGAVFGYMFQNQRTYKSSVIVQFYGPWEDPSIESKKFKYIFRHYYQIDELREDDSNFKELSNSDVNIDFFEFRKNRYFKVMILGVDKDFHDKALHILSEKIVQKELSLLESWRTIKFNKLSLLKDLLNQLPDKIKNALDLLKELEGRNETKSVPYLQLFASYIALIQNQQELEKNILNLEKTLEENLESSIAVDQNTIHHIPIALLASLFGAVLSAFSLWYFMIAYKLWKMSP